MSEMENKRSSFKLTIDHVAGGFFVLVALVVAWESHEYPLGRLSAPGPGYMPLLLAAALGVFGAVLAFKGKAAPLLNTIEWTEAKRGLLLLVVTGIALLAFERIGYRLTMLCLLIFMLGVVERKNIVPTLVVAIGFTSISHFVFATLLRVHLPSGPWGL